MFSPPLPDGPLGLADSLPHSQPSKSTSSLGKRKRSQRSVAVSAVSASSGGFAKSVKDQAVLYNGGDQCWHCSAPKTHIVRVIGLRETVVGISQIRWK